MDEQELDRAIDRAASELIRCEPSRALSYTVMARVRDDAAPAPRRVLWAAAAASGVVCAAVGVAVMYPAPQTIPSPPAAQPFAIAQPATTAEPPVIAALDTRPTARRSSKPLEREVMTLAPLLPDISPIAPIETVPIEVALIEVPQLAREATSIDAINIEPLTIEPLAASND